MNCQFCPVKGNYTCPKCNANYCSTKCYRHPDHIQCSETFYKQCVQQEMSAVSQEKDVIKKTYEAIKSANEIKEPLDSDDDDENDISERLDGIDLDDTDAVWSKLTDSEKAEFEALVQSGEIGKFVPDFNPWWNLHFMPKKVEEIGHHDKSVTAFKTKMKEKMPKVEASVPKMSEIMGKRDPAKNAKFGLLNVVYCYAFLTKFFRGEFEDLEEFLQLFFRICGNLQQPPKNFDSADLALESAINLVVQNGNQLETAQHTAKEVKTDVFKIVRGPGLGNENTYLLAAISQLKRLLTKSLKVTANHKKDTKLALKKLDFYLAWITEFYDHLKK